MKAPSERLRLRVLALLEEYGFDQRHLAETVGHSPQWASMFLNGKASLPVNAYDKVASFLHVSVGELFGDPASNEQRIAAAYAKADDWQRRAVRELLGVDETDVDVDVRPFRDRRSKRRRRA